MNVNVGECATFKDVAPSKEQALKVLEEAAEVFGAWQKRYGSDRAVLDSLQHQHYIDESLRLKLLDECADVIQATCNLIASLCVEDFSPYMEECRKRNEKRGRY